MDSYRNFGIGTIVWAYYLIDADEDRMQRDIDYFRSYMPLNKAYLENHRGLVDVTQDKMKRAKALFEKNGIKTSGCITSTGLVGERKPSIFDTYCFTDEADRAAYIRIVEELAEVFDEIILDDYFFCSCRCEKCIAAKGKRTWSEYRLELMEDFSRVITKRAKEINPRMNFIIKYPNWYESWQETGYNPEKQKDIFDMVYTGTETRDPVYSQQHLQRYHSFSLVRYLENIAPGRNGGGWIDPFGSEDDISRWIEQADLTVLAGARELMLFNFEEMMTNKVFPPLGKALIRMDDILEKLGTPVGTSVYEPHNGDGEDLLYTYLGMGGAAFSPTPDFCEDAPAIFLTQSSCVDRDIMEKVERYVRNGGTAVATIGFMKEQYDKGIKDMTSLRLTGRKIAGSQFMINFRNHVDTAFIKGRKAVSYEVLRYKTNASWSDVSLICGEYNFPILLEDNYGKGRLFILNIPDNFADLYKLPREVWAAVNKVMSIGRDVYAASDEKISMLTYDNDTFGVQSYAGSDTSVRVFIREGVKGIRDLESGELYAELQPQPEPSRWFDGCTTMPEPLEYAIDIELAPGEIRFFGLVR